MSKLTTIDSPALARRTGIWGFSRSALAVGMVLGTSYYFAAFLYICLRRIHYPFSLEWMEGESLVQVVRLLNGKLIYVRPSYEYVALPYTPLYFYVSSLFARLLGMEMFSLRLVSFLSSLACLALSYLICRRENTRLVPAIVASGLFAATYQLSGTWFDVARSDMLATALALCSIYLLLHEGRVWHVAAGISLALACLTKQTYLLVLLVMCVYFILLDRRNALPFALSSLAFLGLASLALDLYHAGWYRFYTITIAFGFGASPSMTPSLFLKSIPEFWIHGLLQPLPVASFLVVAYALAALGFGLGNEQNPSTGVPGIRVIRHTLPSDKRRRIWFYMFCAAAMLGTSWVSIAHQGSYRNDLVPAFAILSVLLGLGIQKVCYEPDATATQTNLALGACILQFASLYYPIGPQIPTQADLLAGRALVDMIREQPGKVYVAFHPELAWLAGKPTYASWDTMYQLEGDYGGGDVGETRRVKAQFSSAMARHEFSMVVLDKSLNWVWGHPERYYATQESPVFDRPGVFWPVTGWQVRPTFIMLPIAP
jgi:hypothetical protein